ncbi:MAG: hypothetical protein A2086_00670 [Spirochaetes bacterium GWD1_27_9]|nr:MAG: hypothetical protein A2Z98_05180 [Spirochaetes bacterium GWB1_27_13]OHD21723.1 MAG: hypothetical protein A2Y34_08470 [Spirochaetes bacterium GWC1_27_15]OHD32523.1 MAG: hypothetical protein A2086_00670 [Spirochaetes bacterium GWD1_27_9]
MKKEIYYFSGTGNSLVVARNIAEKIDAKLTPISSVIDKENIEIDADVIGIIFPFYYLNSTGMPLIISRFIKKLTNISKKYIFAVCTYGGSPYLVIKNLSKIIESSGGKLAAGFGVHMPQCAFKKPFENKKKILDKTEKKVDIICEYITSQKKGRYETDNIFVRLIVVLIRPIAIKEGLKSFKKLAKLPDSSNLSFEELILLSDNSYYTDEKCNGCGICSKICPVNNIKIINNKPVWQNHCENCLACFNWCPKEAIHGGIAPNEYKYHHPDVKLSDMLRQN